MILNKAVLTFVGAMLSMAIRAACINQDFDGLATGVYSNLGVYGTGVIGASTGTSVTVASITNGGLLSSGSMDHVLKLGGAGTPAYSVTFTGDALTQGVFRISFACDTAFNLMLGGNGSSGQIQLYASTDNRFATRVISGGVTNWVYFDQGYAKNTAQTLVINFDNTLHIFTGLINGTNLTIGTASNFVYAKETSPTIGSVNLTWYKANTAFYADNIKLVPATPVVALPNLAALDRVWSNRKQYFIDSINARLSNLDPEVLYDTQIYTANLLRFAAATKNIPQLDGLAEVYLEAHKYLTLTNRYVYSYWPGDTTQSIHDLEAPTRMWLGDPADTDSGVLGLETILNSGQFLYAVAYLIHAIADLPAAQRTANMTNLVAKYTPVVLTDHYHRWIFSNQGVFQRKAWGGESGLYNHTEFLLKLLNRDFGQTKINPVSYLNIVTDTDMWIIAGAAEMLAANAVDSVLVPIVEQERTNLVAYVGRGAELVQDRLTPDSLTNFKGEVISGLNFEIGEWDDHNDYRYAGYTGAISPLGQGWANMPATNIAWDISHARRFVNFFETLYRNKTVMGLSFPDRLVMEGLSAQLIYGVCNKDADSPLFSNFMDGQNGWYRVEYHPGFPGYEPYGMATAFLNGGYGFWAEFNPDIANVRDAMWNKLNSVYTADLSGNHREGIASGQWTAGSDANGSPGFMTFSGTNYITAGKDSAYASSAGTIEFWFKPAKTNKTEDLANIFENSYNDYLLIRRLPDNKIRVSIKDDDIERVSLTSSVTVAVEVWNHIAVTQNGETIKIYINGVQTASTNSVYWTGHLSIAGVWFAKGHWSSFEGSMDDVRVYSRALAVEEISQDMAGQILLPSSNMLSRWEFDDRPHDADREFISDYYTADYSKPDSLSLLMFMPVLIATDDVDGDGLPDDWERLYYGGIADINSGTVCSNGINTAMDAYVAGLNPTDASSVFSITQFEKNVGNPNHCALHWNKVDGRAYTIYWTSNLLNGFSAIPLADRITSGAFTDTVHSANNQGFYRIKVEVSP